MTDTENNIDWKRYFIVLLVVTAGIKAILMGIPEITPQGAYYWQYSRHLDWGYFDHPGMTAYTIRFFTTILGNNLYGIRMNSLVNSIGFTIMLFLFVRRLYDERAAFWTCFAMSLTPLGIVGGIFVTPDPALIFFWTTSLYFFHRAWKEERGVFYALAGVTAGLAMLSKYTAVFLFVGFAIMLFATARGRKALRTPWPWIALVLSVLFFFPQIYWNYKNDWASFAFQST